MHNNTLNRLTLPPRVEILLALLRMAIGWHFLYEGWTKLLYPGWTAAGFLASAGGPFSGFFHWLGANPIRLRAVDLLNEWGLLAAGVALMLGIMIRPAAMAGAGLLGLYYIAHPPLFSPVAQGAEGAYVIVDRNVVELLALVVVFALPADRIGLQRLLNGRRKAATSAPDPDSRRELAAALLGLPVLGAPVLSILRKHGWHSFEETAFRTQARGKRAFSASATVPSFRFQGVSDPRGQMPRARIGDLPLSRMILGGNLIGGWAHARDLIYASKLVKAYHTRDKIFETFALAERCGVNTVLTNPALCGVINDYWRAGGKIQFISDCGGSKNVLEGIARSIDQGASACYFHGGIADSLVEQGKFDVIAKGLDVIRSNRLPAGIGGHKLATIRGCVENGLHPDFWMKTLHRNEYWSSKQPESWVGGSWAKADNIWCEDAEAVAEYMKALPEPWMAFKILAAGAIHPDAAFRYAFESGADFIVVGMYDFQIVEDVNLAISVLNGPLVRRRDWRVWRGGPIGAGRADLFGRDAVVPGANAVVDRPNAGGLPASGHRSPQPRGLRPV
ncbi:MAG: DoxX family protein [Bryobacterales bacterium]|nr:DoxX family protein [Bryobacterales bacterium]